MFLPKIRYLFPKFCFCISLYWNFVSFDCALDHMWSLHISAHVQSVLCGQNFAKRHIKFRNCWALYFGVSKEFHSFLQTLPGSRAGASACLHCLGGGLKYLKRFHACLKERSPSINVPTSSRKQNFSQITISSTVLYVLQ